MINFKTYQDGAKSTAVYPESAKLIYPALGLCGESGEVAEKIKKIIRDGNGEVTPEKRTEILKEIGDVLWYIAALCTDLDADMGDVAQANLSKLQSRKERGVIHGNGDNR